MFRSKSHTGYLFRKSIVPNGYRFVSCISLPDQAGLGWVKIRRSSRFHPPKWY